MRLRFEPDFATVCARKIKSGDRERVAKSNGGLVLQLLKWKAKVMLHANGRGDMWWTSVDVSKMSEAYRELVDVIQAQQTTADAPRTDSQEGDQHGD